MPEAQKQDQRPTKVPDVPPRWMTWLMFVGLALIVYGAFGVIAGAMGESYLEIIDSWRVFFGGHSHRDWVEQHLLDPTKNALRWIWLGGLIIVVTSLTRVFVRRVLARWQAQEESDSIAEEREWHR